MTTFGPFARVMLALVVTTGCTKDERYERSPEPPIPQPVPQDATARPPYPCPLRVTIRPGDLTLHSRGEFVDAIPRKGGAMDLSSIARSCTVIVNAEPPIPFGDLVAVIQAFHSRVASVSFTTLHDLRQSMQSTDRGPDGPELTLRSITRPREELKAAPVLALTTTEVFFGTRRLGKLDPHATLVAIGKALSKPTQPTLILEAAPTVPFSKLEPIIVSIEDAAYRDVLLVVKP